MSAGFSLRNAVLSLFLLLSAAPALAVPLTAQDKADLTASLQSLSTGWVQADVDRANTILTNGNYAQADWQVFFTGYFAANPLNYNLYNYLQYPVFSWFGDDVHKRLQDSLLTVLPARFDSIVSANKTNLSGYLQNNPNARATLRYTNIMISRLQGSGLIDPSIREQAYQFHLQQFNGYPTLWKSTVTYNVQTQPYLAWIRSMLMANLVENQPLTAARKTEVAQAMGLTGAYQQIWDTHSVLVSANNGLDSVQLATIDSFLNQVPRNLHQINVITVLDFFGELTGAGDEGQWLTSRSGINIFGVDVGAVSENPFPSDVAPTYSDLFGSALAHEINHMVDFHSVQAIPALKARWDQLLSQAGSPKLNYLRSVHDQDFFLNAPQEFFASISNQWFSDSARTLDLALTRWENGYKEPLNQFLFFGKIHAQNSGQMPFYTMDTGAALTKTLVPVQYGANGDITQLTYNGGVYGFTLDANGNVVETTNPRPHTLGGTVSGMTGSGLVLTNGGDSVTLNDNGAFVFGQKITQGTAYNVIVSAQPASHTCSVTNGGGTMGSKNVTNVQVTCVGGCTAVTATNANHVTAGRAYTQVTGTWFKTTTWYAKGSNQSLGTSGSTSTQLAQTSPGYWVKGACPSAPTVSTPNAAVNGTSVTVTGTATGASKVELEFDSNGTWIQATGTTSWSLTKSGLSVGTHTVRARASNSSNMVSAPSAAVSFTTTEAPVEVCFTDVNTAHASAGRATVKYGSLYYANGSNTYLGIGSASTSLKQQGANYWVKVTSCP